MIAQDGVEPFGLGSFVEVWGEPYHADDDDPVFEFRGARPAPGGSRVARPSTCTSTRGSTRRPTPTWSRRAQAQVRRPRPRRPRGAAHCPRRGRSSTRTVRPPGRRGGLLDGTSAPRAGASPTGWRRLPAGQVHPDVLYVQAATCSPVPAAPPVDASLHLMRQTSGQGGGRRRRGSACPRTATEGRRSSWPGRWWAATPRRSASCSPESRRTSASRSTSTRLTRRAPHVAAHLRPPVPRRDRHHPARVGDGAAAAGGRGAARARRLSSSRWPARSGSAPAALRHHFTVARGVSPQQYRRQFAC